MASNFENDIEKEKLNREVIEKSVLKDIFSSYDYVDDTILQKDGVDYICKFAREERDIKLDIKEASDYFNRPEELQTYVFELFNTTRIPNNITNIGWGLKQLSTTHYLMLKPLEKCEDICTYFEAILVDKKLYAKILSRYIGYYFDNMYFPNKKQELQNIVDCIQSKQISRFNEIDTDMVKLFVMANNYYNTIIDYNKNQYLDVGSTKIFYSGTIHEGPVNLVVPWQFIIDAADKYSWYHRIIRYSTLTKEYVSEEYSETIVENALGQEYIINLHNRIRQGDAEIWQNSL